MMLARLRLRGAYAVVAALLLLLIAPLYQTATLGADYQSAVQTIATHHDFGPYLLWISQNVGADRVSRLIQLVAYALAATVAGPLVAALWAARAPDARFAPFVAWRPSALVARLAGWVGFGLFAIVLVVGAFTSESAANSYAAAASAAQRNTIAVQFGATYAVETILSRVIGGLIVALFLGLICSRMVVTRSFPRWLPYLGALTVIMLAANAVLFVFAPAQVETVVSTPATAGLALWLAGLGVLLARLKAMPDAPDEADAADAVSGAEHTADAAAPNTPTVASATPNAAGGGDAG
ncbi:MAG TPA: hypothetical protein VMV29_16765 [Ktedonobacterales bacterium]|nr:hypothetical protein [Ktedonobacterales bacterium]